ncbi:DMT family transporter [Microvirga sp. 2MCAF38]|uniref:DMT family transporter n=1 Tax=Microvirga sp. 2MCAF38 TaxID=3232989 RepID=UPI003F9C32C2
MLTTLAMFAFAGNSLLCRLALKNTGVDAATFTLVRVVSAALALWLILRVRSRPQGIAGNWYSALALVVYASAFSFAYIQLPAGTGALLLFGAVQATMIGYGLWTGERLHALQWAGLLLAVGGLVGLVLPGISAPPLLSSLLMLGAGAAWGIYSLRGKSSADATETTAGNFLRAVPFAAALGLLFHAELSFEAAGLGYAVLSGAITSGVGYVIWYAALKDLKATIAATVQLSVPVITAIGGIILLGEALTLRLFVSSAAVLGGIALLVAKKAAK